LPKLISEKKFINVVKNLTIFVEEFNKDGILKKIYINEKVDQNNSKIIVADSGKIIKKNNQFYLRLYDGGITNLNKVNSFVLNFSETDYDLSIFSTKSITHPKMQEINSLIIINCFKEFLLNLNNISQKSFRNATNQTCHDRELKSISDELYKRLVLPFYTLIISLIAASLIVEPKSKYFFRFHKLNIFLIGSFIIILSQISLKFFLSSISAIYTILLLPVMLVLIYYIILIFITKFKLNFL
ncbi:MAG: hypothetical protein CBB94_16395, partial [Gammaproteobacteria bacterium TMED34]